MQHLDKLGRIKMDAEVINNLKRSRMILGEIYPIIVESGSGIILAGKHRREAGWQSVKEIKISDIVKAFGLPETMEAFNLARCLFEAHSNVQRKPSKDETRNLILYMAQNLEAMHVPKEKISSILSKMLPYSDRYIRDLLPDEYKMPTKPPEELRKSEAELAPLPKTVTEEKPIRTKEELKKLIESIPATSISSIYDEVECPYCGNKIRVFWLERRIAKINSP